MVLFMIYYITLYLLQFLIVSVTFVFINVFFDELFLRIFGGHSGIVKKAFFNLYLGVIILTIIVTIALPIDRSIGKIKFFSVIISILMNLTLLGVTYVLVRHGFYPPVTTCIEDKQNPGSCEFQVNPDGETYFSTLCLAGVISLLMFLLPMVMRPLDFLYNFKLYTLGFVSYIAMMPVITIMFQIYAVCNLHDVTWGNRPTSNGRMVLSNERKRFKK